MDTTGFISNHVNYRSGTGSTCHRYGVSQYRYGMRKSDLRVTCVQPYSQGFIYHLGQVNKTTLQAAMWLAMSPLWNDTSLSVKLICVDRKNNIWDFLTTTNTNIALTITSLLTACRDIQMMPRQRWPENLDKDLCLYNKATCFKFHQLLISTLLSFSKALMDMRTLMTRVSKTCWSVLKRSILVVPYSGPLHICGYRTTIWRCCTGKGGSTCLWTHRQTSTSSSSSPTSQGQQTRL